MTASARLLLRVLCMGIPLLCVQIHAIACDDSPWRSDIQEASERFKIDAAWIRAVMRIESNACEELDGGPTTSKAGAMGLMQLMPATWIQYREQLGLRSDPYNAHDNILVGAAYLRDLIARFGLRNGLAAYAAGPQRIEDGINGHGSMASSVDRYVAQVLRIASDQMHPWAAVQTVPSHADDVLFSIRHAADTQIAIPSDSKSSTLFAIIKVQPDVRRATPGESLKELERVKD
jgi:hypothetical protein